MPMMRARFALLLGLLLACLPVAVAQAPVEQSATAASFSRSN